MHKIKDLNGEKKYEAFMKKDCCWVNYNWVIIKKQTVVLEVQQSSISFVKLCYSKK